MNKAQDQELGQRQAIAKFVQTLKNNAYKGKSADTVPPEAQKAFKKLIEHINSLKA